MAELQFGTKTCDVAGYEACWVQFKLSGYPRRLRREWDASDNADATWAIVMRYVTGWKLTDLAGNDVPLPDGDRPLSIVDDVEDAVVTWLTRAFIQFWLVELVAPRPNS